MPTFHKIRNVLALAVFLVAGLPLVAQPVPQLIDYQGRILDGNGQAVHGTVKISFSIYAEPTGGTSLWYETHEQVYVSHGVFHVLLGSVNPLPGLLFQSPDRYVSIQVNNDGEMLPRSRIASVPYALQAGNAPGDTDWMISGNTIYRMNGNVGIGTPAPGEMLSVADTIESTLGGFKFPDGTVQSTAVSGANSGTITSVSADSGLVGGGTTGNVSLKVKFGDSGTADAVAHSDHLHDGVDIATGTVAIGRLPVGTTSGTVASGSHDHSTGTPISESGLTTDVAWRLVTEGDAHTHTAGHGGPIPTAGLADKAVTSPKLRVVDTRYSSSGTITGWGQAPVTMSISGADYNKVWIPHVIPRTVGLRISWTYDVTYTSATAMTYRISINNLSGTAGEYLVRFVNLSD